MTGEPSAVEVDGGTEVGVGAGGDVEVDEMEPLDRHLISEAKVPML